jgi:DNA mismatch repair ATPase MutS
VGDGSRKPSGTEDKGQGIVAGLGKTKMGRFYEFYDDQAESAMRLFGLKMIEARRGFQIRCGFPINFKERYLRRLLELGFSVHIVREEESWLSGVKQRSIAEGWIPSKAG